MREERRVALVVGAVEVRLLLQAGDAGSQAALHVVGIARRQHAQDLP